MAKGISIGIAADAKPFSAAVKSGVLDPLQDTVDALRDVDKAGSRLDIEDTMRDAQRDTERLADETDELADALRAATRRARDFGDDTKRATRKAEDGADDARRAVGDMGDEAADTGREMAASFSEPADALDAVQELAANALTGLGPAGVVAGGAAAVGIGLASTALQDAQEEADALKEAMGAAFREAVEEGRTYLDEAQIIAGVNDILFDPEKQSVYELATRDAETLGVTLNDVLRAQAGDQEAINLLIEAGKARAEEMRDAQWGTADANVATAAELGKSIARYENLNTLADENRARAERSLEIERTMGAEERGNIQRAKDADAARWQAQAAAIDRAREKASQPATLVVNVSTAEAERRINELVTRKREIEIGVRYRNGKPVDAG